jgi:lipopolysaccharide/colanic/teichoic acid biosynthesis glycosyltransferase
LANETEGGVVRERGNHSQKVLEDCGVPWWKRCIDITIILVFLPALLPIIVLLSIYIKLVSRGPLLFRQDRTGIHAKPFKCLKFRSMKVDVDHAAHQHLMEELIHSNRCMTKLDRDGDPRMIPGGQWFRATGLDELPQLLNVLRGEMSIVGPRPCTTYEFIQLMPFDYERFNTAPGITGLWQVSGKNRTTFREMIDLDIYYCRHLSPILDLKIVTLTPLTVIAQVKDLIVSRVKSWLLRRNKNNNKVFAIRESAHPELTWTYERERKERCQ